MSGRLELPLAAADPNGSRHAALFLHGIADADRAWLLDAIGAPGRAALEPLLVELDALGVPASASLAAELLRQPQVSVPAAPLPVPPIEQPAAPSPAERLGGVSAAALLSALGDAPDSFVVRLLRHVDARRRRAVLRGFDVARRHRIEAALANTVATDGAAKLDEAVLQATLDRASRHDGGERRGLHRRARARLVSTWQRLALQARRRMGQRP